MRYRYLDDFGRGISVFAIFSYGIAVLGTPQCPPPWFLSIIQTKVFHVWPTARHSQWKPPYWQSPGREISPLI